MDLAAIIQRGDDATVRGLTTAASLLFTASVGICVALRELLLAVGVILLALIILRLLGRWEQDWTGGAPGGHTRPDG